MMQTTSRNHSSHERAVIYLGAALVALQELTRARGINRTTDPVRDAIGGEYLVSTLLDTLDQQLDGMSPRGRQLIDQLKTLGVRLPVTARFDLKGVLHEMHPELFPASAG